MAGGQVEVYHIGFAGDNQDASTPENTSLSSSNSSVLPSSYEQSSSESLFRRRDSRLEQRAKADFFTRGRDMVPESQRDMYNYAIKPRRKTRNVTSGLLVA